jgi:tritrans,polycis-undecaprenyl-diphosphate synthase [geranylgeranyl-diphosphate specific]
LRKNKNMSSQYLLMQNKNNLPGHIAIIPDGNRHWARERGLKPWDGHEQGAKNTEKITREALMLGIKCLSFWGSSLENLKKRPLEERRALLQIYEKYFKRIIESDDIHKNKVRINIIGRWREQFPERLKKVLEEGIKKTKQYNNYALNFFLAYNGDDEMIGAVKGIIKSGLQAEKVTGKTIKENLMTKDLPPVDLLIRTGGEPHLSVGFMMWDIANAQMYFPDKYYPEFGEKEFGKAVEEYQRRERRHGK